MHSRLVFSLAGVAVAGVLFSVYAQNTVPRDRTAIAGSRSLGTPKQFRNLTLIPVYDTAAKASGDYLTLDEGLKARIVAIKESGSGGEVNTLHVTNKGRKPVYLMAGEVVLGGQQDRCVGRDTIIPPGKRNQPVTVFCVEHGRWNGKGEFDRTAKAVASADIRASAQEGALAPAAAVVSDAAPSTLNAQTRSGRQTVGRPSSGGISGAQSKVWQKVEEKNTKFKAQNATGTYRGVLEMSAGEAGRSVAPYEKALAGALGKDPHLVGVVAAINGKVVGADVFGDPGLFRKLWPKLLRSYAADAAEQASAARKSVPAVTAASAKAFLTEASDAKSRTENKTDVSTSLRLESTNTLSYRLQPAKAAGGGAGMPAALHENHIRK
jgi:hypothetical protein